VRLSQQEGFNVRTFGRGFGEGNGKKTRNRKIQKSVVRKEW